MNIIHAMRVIFDYTFTQWGAEFVPKICIEKNEIYNQDFSKYTELCGDLKKAMPEISDILINLNRSTLVSWSPNSLVVS